jgi:serine protease Do
MEERTMTYVSSARRKRLTWHLAIIASAAAAVATLLFANLSTAQDRSAAVPSPGAFAGAVSFADVVEQASPAVVTISVTKVARPMPTSGLQRLPRGSSPLDEFFGRFFDMPGMPGAPGVPRAPRESQALGSGFVIDEEGYIATNRHVIEGADQVLVTLDAGQEITATVVGQDEHTDLALLKIDPPEGLPTLTFGDSDRARVGEWVVAIGNPFGLGGTATAGIISARGRDIQSGPYDDYLQIDASINFGNSGGPVFNAAGEVIGINTAIFSPNGGNIGIGFAIPANQAKKVIADLKENGQVNRGWLGVQIQGLDEGLAQGLGFAGTEGALIADVVADGPADRAGLRPGDIVTEFAGKAVDSPKALGRLVAEQASGSRASMTVWRDGSERELSVQLGQRDEPAQAANAAPAVRGGDAGAALGLSMQDLSPAHRQELGIDAQVEGALVVGVQPGSPAEQQGIEPGDVILQVNQKQIDSAKDVLDELAASRADGRRALVLLRRGDAQRFVALNFA